MINKPIIVMDFSSTGKDGGPFISSTRIMESELNKKYEFKSIIYRTELGANLSLKRIIDLRNQILELKPDIVHFTGLQLSGLHVALACKLAKAKNTIVTIHGFSGDAIDFNPIKKWILTLFLEPLTLLISKKNYGVSEYVVSRRMVKLFPKKCFGAIYNLPPEQKITSKNNKIRNELGISSSNIIAISVGRIIKDKGYHVLDEAILHFKENNNLKFIIIGVGDYLPEMKKKLEGQVLNNQVFFLGYRNDVQNVLSDCNFFLLPTLHETLSIALLEASMEGLALIASDTGGVPEIVKNGYNGLLVSPGSVYELTEAIDKMYNDFSLRTLFGNNAKVRLSEKFSSRVIVSQIDKLYQSLLNK